MTGGLDTRYPRNPLSTDYRTAGMPRIGPPATQSAGNLLGYTDVPGPPLGGEPAAGQRPGLVLEF